jgi:hypothetical protein
LKSGFDEFKDHYDSIAFLFHSKKELGLSKMGFLFFVVSIRMLKFLGLLGVVLLKFLISKMDTG